MKSTNLKPIESPAFRIRLGSGFVLLYALIFFFDEDGFLAALLPVVLMHEIGHVLVMLFLGARPLRLEATLQGLKMDYSGTISDKQELAAALGGPTVGLIFSFLCARLGRSWGSDYLTLCAGLGFVLNIFNLLPAMPLDGGRALGFVLRFLFGGHKGNALLRGVSLCTALIVTLLGLYLAARGFGIALLLAAAWLFIARTNKTCK